ncbi:Aste57867_21218 [Aphanomyces stellatus]|uniref:Aste57867_21218 protein n=1 Tax=Aphanomyces stellatus TaxID=120398 RepID=A0A485LH11_9STRA|nr:hypothetical protein As57867_021150 [Aphanomyces stellatus]VFT97890.1 Aste57867_21218 [Aphanomyces stellatus]
MAKRRMKRTILWIMAQFIVPSSALVVESPCCHIAEHIPAQFGANITDDADFVRREVVAAKPFDACIGDIENDMSGKIALILRGKCNFAWKVLQAQRANAVAVVVMDFEARTNEPWELLMVGDANATNISIPSVYVSHETGQSLLSNTESPVLLTLNKTGHKTTVDRHHTVVEGIVLYVLSTSIMFIVLSGLCLVFSNLATWYQRHGRTRAAKRLPIKAYEATSDDEEMCSICLETFETNATVKVLPCNHEFHQECIDPWLENRSSQCPLCKGEALEGYMAPQVFHLDGQQISSPFHALMYGCMVLPILVIAIVVGVVF